MADRISNLPEEILLHIVSLLTIEDVIATSLVSKRWRPLWLSIPTINFDEGRYLKRQCERCFVDFVCATIQARGLHQPIRGFRLRTCDVHPELEWLNKAMVCLNEAIQRGVENVEIDSFPVFEMPSNIFNCATLVVLKLHCASFRDGFSSVYLPSLKTLHLNLRADSCAHFLKPQDFLEFLYGCPILENLIANDICFDDGSFMGEFKSLSKLVRAEICDIGEEEVFHIPLKVFSTVKFLSFDQCNGDIPMFPNLIHMELINVEFEWNSVLDILKCSPNLETLVLDFNYSSCEDWSNLQFVPECFSSQLKKCVIANYTGTVNQMRFVKYVMQNSTSLHVMTVNYTGDDHQERHKILTELASCPRSSATCQLLFK